MPLRTGVPPVLVIEGRKCDCGGGKHEGKTLGHTGRPDLIVHVPMVLLQPFLAFLHCASIFAVLGGGKKGQMACAIPGGVRAVSR